MYVPFISENCLFSHLTNFHNTFSRCNFSMWFLPFNCTMITRTQQEDDIKAILNFIWCGYKEQIFTSKFFNRLSSEVSLSTLHNCCVSCSLDYLILWLESKSRFSVLEFFGSHYLFLLLNEMCYIFFPYWCRWSKEDDHLHKKMTAVHGILLSFAHLLHNLFQRRLKRV